MFRRLCIVFASFLVLLQVTSTPIARAAGLINPKADLATNLKSLYPLSVRIIVFLAFLAVIMAGYTYITSFGKPERITEAKNWLIAAVTGVALILLVPVIISFLESIPLPGTK